MTSTIKRNGMTILVSSYWVTYTMDGRECEREFQTGEGLKWYLDILKEMPRVDIVDCNIEDWDGMVA